MKVVVRTLKAMEAVATDHREEMVVVATDRNSVVIVEVAIDRHVEKVAEATNHVSIVKLDHSAKTELADVEKRKVQTVLAEMTIDLVETTAMAIDQNSTVMIEVAKDLHVEIAVTAIDLAQIENRDQDAMI
jgi:hypothetical protein